ncbi:hypothetical protein DL98DRAFT_515679 [Cadophora sp. DSE1049]|nr:hypothetical protein DL98DRAFT_515679 [Cadophora sp. DSE1049]
MTEIDMPSSTDPNKPRFPSVPRAWSSTCAATTSSRTSRNLTPANTEATFPPSYTSQESQSSNSSNTHHLKTTSRLLPSPHFSHPTSLFAPQRATSPTSVKTPSEHLSAFPNPLINPQK